MKATSSTRPALRAARTIVLACSPSIAIGFSESTCRPRSSAATAIGACRKVGTATLTASRPFQLEQVLPAREVVRDAVLGDELRPHVVLEPGDPDQLDAVDLAVGVDVLLAGPAEPDDADLHRHHPTGDCGLPNSVVRSRGAAHCTAFASTRLMSGWW